MENVINLRTESDTNISHKPPFSMVPAGEREIWIAWTAPEYTAYTYTTRWFLWVGSITLFLAILAILTQNYFFLAFIAIAFIVIIMYMKRTPRDIAFAITKEGVNIGHKFHPWKELKSFWIFDISQGKDLSLETNKMLTPYFRIPLSGVNPDEIRETLKHFIPEKEHEELAADQIGKNLGF